MKFYSCIHDKSDVAKISNLAYEEMIVSFLEIIYKFDGIDFLYNELLNDNNDKFKLKVSMFILPYNLDRGKNLINICTKSNDKSCGASATNVLKYLDENFINSYKSILDKIRKKKNIWNFIH